MQSVVAYAYDPDDWNPAEDLEVQQRIDGSAWHRRAIGGRETACGRPIHAGNNLGMRHESYLGELCSDGCYSRHELDLSAEANAAQREQDIEDNR